MVFFILVYASVRDEKELQDRTVAGLRRLNNCGEDHPLPPIIRVLLLDGLGAHWEEKVLLLSGSFSYVIAPKLLTLGEGMPSFHIVLAIWF